MNYAHGKEEADVITDETDSKEYELPKSTAPEADYANSSPIAVVNPSSIYQPLRISTVERETCYAAPQRATAGSGGHKI